MAISYKEYLPIEVKKKLENTDDVVLVDVRELDEWQSGHVPNAKHIPLGEIPYRLQELDPQKETIIICRSGNRSGRACEFLSAKGYKVVNMLGGMLQWGGEVERG